MPIFLQMTILLATVLLILPVSKRIGLPIVTGYIIVGIILSGLIYIFEQSFTLTYALMDFSVITLMFFLGLHVRPSILQSIPLSLAKLHLLALFILGSIFTLLIWGFTSISLIASVLLGFAFGFSGFTLLLPILKYQRKNTANIGNFEYRFLILNITFFTFLLILMPIFASINTPQHGIAYIAAIIATSSGLFWFAQSHFKKCFHFLARYQSTELIIVFVIAFCGGVLSLMQVMQMPLGLGALLCGIILADAPFRSELHQHLNIWTPLLIGLFFTSIALQLSFEILAQHFAIILIAVFILMLSKISLWATLLVLQKKNLIQAVSSGINIAHSAECTLVIILLALTAQIINTQQAQILSWVAILSVLLNPCLQVISQYLLHKKSNTSASEDCVNDNNTSVKDLPIIIAGFGRFGQMIGRVAHLQNLPFIAIDNTIDEIDFLSNYGGDFITADLTDPEQIQQLPLNNAKMFILAIDDVDDAMTIARYLHLHHPQLPILARARDRHHAYLLQELGVHYVWRETWHSALELAKRMMLLDNQTDADAEHWLKIFRQYDERLLSSNQGIYAHMHHVTESTQNTIQELENLFENDLFVQQQQHFPQKDKSVDSLQATTTSP